MVYIQPNSYEEAANILDTAYPGWHKLIDKDTLNMKWSNKCILGQIGKGDDRRYYPIMEKLFGERGNGNHPFFGIKANKDKWIELINQRFEQENKGMNFGQALELIKQGKEVRRIEWNQTHNYIKMSLKNMPPLSKESILAEDWEEVDESVKFVELKLGQRFIYKGIEYTKIRYYASSMQELGLCVNYECWYFTPYERVIPIGETK